MQNYEQSVAAGHSSLPPLGNTLWQLKFCTDGDVILQISDAAQASFEEGSTLNINGQSGVPSGKQLALIKVHIPTSGNPAALVSTATHGRRPPNASRKSELFQSRHF